MSNYKSNKNKNQDKDIMENYASKKKGNERVFKLIKKHKTVKTQARIKDCAVWLEMKGNEDLTEKRLINSNRCKNAYCPFCSSIKAKKNAFKISVMVSYIEKFLKKEFIFITLTAPNVINIDLNNEIDNFNKAFARLSKRKEVDRINKGYVRKLEITYNKHETITKEMYENQKMYFDNKDLKIGDYNPNFDTYHTHFHILMAVNKSYFTDKTYIKQERWLNLWQEAMKNNEITQVDVRKITNRTIFTENRKSEKKEIVLDGKIKNVVLEIAKYSAKSSDYAENAKVFDVFYNALEYKRLLTYNKLFKESHELFKKYQKLKKQEEREKHILHQFFEQDNNKYIYFLLYNWGHGKYIEAEKKEFTEEELKKYNSSIIDFIDD